MASSTCWTPGPILELRRATRSSECGFYGGVREGGERSEPRSEPARAAGCSRTRRRSRSPRWTEIESISQRFATGAMWSRMDVSREARGTARSPWMKLGARSKRRGQKISPATRAPRTATRAEQPRQAGRVGAARSDRQATTSWTPRRPADEMAQGAKPGEEEQLPATKCTLDRRNQALDAGSNAGFHPRITTSVRSRTLTA